MCVGLTVQGATARVRDPLSGRPLSAIVELGLFHRNMVSSPSPAADEACLGNFTLERTCSKLLSRLLCNHIDGETVETVSDFILGGSKITADGDYSREMKRHLLLGRKVMTNVDSIFKSRDITLPTK